MDTGLAHLVSWSEETKGDVPPPLTGPSVTISPLPAPHPPAIFLFGGKSVQTRRLTSEMWAMDVASRVWEKVDAGNGPGPRYFHSMDMWEDKLVCFGGMSDSDPMSVHNDIWFFDCTSRQWLPQPNPSSGSSLPEQDPSLLPSARYAHLSAITNGRLVISGGQHSDNSWIYEINVYDLRRKVWVSRTEQPEMQGQHTKGAYRSVTTSAKQRVIEPPASTEIRTTHSYSIDEEGEGGDIWCYSNYDFAKVRRELDIISTNLSIEPAPSDKHIAPPSFAIRDNSYKMRGSSQPPGLRFPTGSIVGNHFILCGLYLASSSAAFSIWALNLDTMLWKHLEPQVLSTGSWNRAIVWPETARIVVFGNTSHDLASDYSRRAVNLDHVAVVSLEAYGIYQPPKLEVTAKAQQVGLSMLDEKLASDFEIISEDERRIPCSRRILSDRWAWFAEQEKALSERLEGVLKDQPVLDIDDTLLGSFTPARLTPTGLNISEPFPVCVALIQYFYTLALSTPLQNRAPVLSALLFIAKHYRIERLAKLVLHALHERLEPAIAVGIYEIATLAGEQYLQVRALNMIHAARASASRSQPHRQGPSTASAGEAANMSTPANGPPSSAGAPGSAASAAVANSRAGSYDDGPYRRARADSLTVPLDILEAEPIRELEVETTDGQVDALLAALDFGDLSARSSIPAYTQEEISQTGSSASAALLNHQLPLRQTSLPAGPPSPPPSRSLPPTPPTPETSYTDLYPTRPHSPAISDVTLNYPATPAESVQDGWNPPSGSMAYQRDSGSSHGHGHGYGFPGSGSAAHLRPEPFDTGKMRLSAVDTSRDYTHEQLDVNRQRCTSDATLEPSTSITLSYPPSSFNPQRQRTYLQATWGTSTSTSVNSQYYQSPTTTSSHDHDVRSHRKLSISSHFSGASHCTYALSQNEMNLAGPGNATSTLTDCSMSTKTQSSLSRISTATFSVKSMDTFSINSGSTGTSSKNALKAELKAVRTAEKSYEKAEAHAKFEALRAEQKKRMGIDKAEAQRRADIDRNEKIVQRTKEKEKEGKERGRWGKLGKGFAEAVLFPSGNGERTTIF